MRLKQFFNLIWNEFVYGGHLLSLGAVSIVYTSAILLNIKITWDFLVIVYLGTYSPYLYNRYKEFNEDFATNPERTKHIEKHVKYIPIMIFLFILVMIGIFLHFNKISALLFAIFLILTSFYYSILFKGLSKKIVGFKSFYVSLNWSLLVILLVIYYFFPLNLAVFLIFAFIFLRFIVSTTFFDIKDIEADKKEGLLTLPNRLKSKGLFIFLILTTLIALLPIILGVYLNVLPIISLLLLFTAPYTFYYLKRVRNKKTDISFLYNVIVDGEFILWSFFIFLGKIFL